MLLLREVKCNFIIKNCKNYYLSLSLSPSIYIYIYIYILKIPCPHWWVSPHVRGVWLVWVWIHVRVLRSSFFCFFFFFLLLRARFRGTKFTLHVLFSTVHALFKYCSHTIYGTHSYFIQKKYIKNRPHGTIHTMMPQFNWLYDVCGCVMSPTSGIY